MIFFSHHLMWVYRNAIKTQTKKATPDGKYLNIDITFMQQRGRKKLTWRLIFNRVLAFSTFSVDYFAFVVTSVKFNRSMDLEDLIIKHWCKKNNKKNPRKNFHYVFVDLECNVMKSLNHQEVIKLSCEISLLLKKVFESRQIRCFEYNSTFRMHVHLYLYFDTRHSYTAKWYLI